ncbi:hypothetical protein BCV70DRAFT_192548 [Testicularia cyperi]|uniref:PLAC8-domain-containing protein n=1 Tax=Testicularia cyperi TaxID=1882483 RepID=A0A317XKA6_9BASI|nr:hypothetical protein BCV70DRAFT_192548 [Testicularia cyperi]
MADGAGVLAASVFGCCAEIVAVLQYNICNNRAYGSDASCCDNCCRCTCCWPQGALPVEDYPIANSTDNPDKAAEDQQRQQTVDGDGETAPPVYSATPQMTASPPAADSTAPAQNSSNPAS